MKKTLFVLTVCLFANQVFAQAAPQTQQATPNSIVPEATNDYFMASDLLALAHARLRDEIQKKQIYMQEYAKQKDLADKLQKELDVLKAK